MTIRRDVTALMCSYPIETVHGGRHGCVRVADGYYLNSQNSDRRALSPRQIELLKEIGKQLDGEKLETLNSILQTFAP